MSATLPSVVTMGYASPGSINLVVTMGYGQGGATPRPTVTQPIRNFSLREWRRWHKPEDEQEFRKLGVSEESAEIIAEVAMRQAESDAQHRLDEQQRLDELRGEMQLRGIAIQSAHIRLLNEERQRLIDAEIAAYAARVRLEYENDNALLLMMIGSI